MVYMNTAAEETEWLSSKHMFIHGCQLCFPGSLSVTACACVRARVRVCVCMRAWCGGSVYAQVGTGAPDQSVPGQTTSHGSSSKKTHVKPRTSKCSYAIQKEKNK